MRRIEYQPIDQLIGAPTNPKRHDVDLVRRSIGRFGYVAPAIVDERTGRLVVGHGRTEALCALRDAGGTPPDGVRQDDTGTWLVPVLRGWSSRSDEEAAAYLVADNRHTELGGWDQQELHDLLTGLEDPDLVDIAGFSATDLDELLTLINEDSDQEASDNQEQDYSGDGTALETLSSVTTPDPTFAIGPGDVWWLGDDHVLVCASPFTDHRLWAPLLTEDAIFMPFPSTMAPFAQTAPGRRIILVQPNAYLAALTATRWERITGQKARQVVDDD